MQYCIACDFFSFKTMTTIVFFDQNQKLLFSAHNVSNNQIVDYWRQNHFILNCPVEQFGDCDCKCSVIENPQCKEEKTKWIGILFECDNQRCSTRCIIYGQHEELTQLTVFLSQFPQFHSLFENLYEEYETGEDEICPTPGGIQTDVISSEQCCCQEPQCLTQYEEYPISQLIPSEEYVECKESDLTSPSQYEYVEDSKPTQCRESKSSNVSYTLPFLAAKHSKVRGRQHIQKKMNHPMYSHPIHAHMNSDIHKKGQYHESKIGDLVQRHRELKKIPIEKRTPKQKTELRQVDFAIRAKRGWPKGKI